MNDSSKILIQLSETTIFGGCDNNALSEIIKKSKIEKFPKGYEIYSKTKFSKCLGLILSGSATVSKENNGHKVVINKLGEGELFGAVTLFGDFDYYVNQITAAEPCEVMFIEKQTVLKLMEKDISFAQNYISYLSERIYFLNKKIESFTAGSAESRLANYLVSCSDSNDEFKLPVNLSALSKTLDIGRSSLYRAFDELISQGLIKRSGKVIIISDRKNLLRYVE